MVENVKLVALSFLASTGFAVVFRTDRRLLLLSGLGGALTRIVYLILIQMVPNRLVYMLLAAMFASLYAEIMAILLKKPSTIFLYPSIVPLIPGDLLYHTTVGLVLSETERVAANAPACLQALCGMAVGFVAISTIMYYVRMGRFYRLLTPVKKVGQMGRRIMRKQ